ncbi:MAG: hydroxymethylglutaryl-CoA synthase [Halobacteriota archaeon]
MEDTGIVGYGGYVPRYRIRTKEIARVWGDDPDKIESGLNIHQKSVPAMDEDTATISVEAARDAVRDTDPRRIEAIYVGSESHPYAVKPTATIVGAAIGATPEMTAADYEFACKAGTAAMQTASAMVYSGTADRALAIGADVSQGAPGDALEYSAAAGGAAFVVGDAGDAVAEIEATASYTSDTPDFWRREGERYPQHGERFTGKPAYFKHTLGAARRLLDEIDAEPEDFDHAVFHQPNGKFPVKAARKLGFTEQQYETGLLSPEIGNTYSGASMLGLVAVLDEARPGDRVFVTSFGSGAGSDAFALSATEKMAEYEGADLRRSFEDTVELDYAEYARHKGKIKEE